MQHLNRTLLAQWTRVHIGHPFKISLTKTSKKWPRRAKCKSWLPEDKLEFTFFSPEGGLKLANMEHLSNEAVKFENSTLVMLEIIKLSM